MRLISDIPLPELPPGIDGDGPPEIEVLVGRVPDRLADSIHEGPILQVGANGSCRYEVTDVAAYLVEAGSRIIVQPHMRTDAPDIRSFLLGSILGFLCFQRGWLPLHACCVEVAGHAIVIAADSGVGKSTLAAAFARRGYGVLADDLTVVDAHAPEGPLVMPALPRIRLWRDVLERFGRPIEGLERCRSQLEKYQVPLPVPFRTEPLPLAAVYRLSRFVDERRTGLFPLTGLEAVEALLASVYRRQAASYMGRDGQILRAVHRLMQLPSQSLNQVHGLERLDETVALLVSRHQQGLVG